MVRAHGEVFLSGGFPGNSEPSAFPFRNAIQLGENLGQQIVPPEAFFNVLPRLSKHGVARGRDRLQGHMTRVVRSAQLHHDGKRQEEKNAELASVLDRL